MAAEASRSSISADSYIGSIISLTSKSEIRYEGVLFNINTDEASIGLRNVRSFGTEGRKKDGQQVPASDIVYEYIVFRGSDIKDLQVKSSPPVPTAPSVHNDPAIIQSHYATPPASSNLPSASAPSSPAVGSISDFNSQVSHPGVPRATYQNNIPLYQPGGMAPWNSSTPPTTNGSSPSVPMYWQGYYGPSGALQLPQQSLVQPVQGLSMPPSVQLSSAQQPIQYLSLHSSSTPGALNVSTSMELPPQMVQTVVSSAMSMQPTMLPVHPSALIPDSISVLPSNTSTQGVPAVSLSSNLTLVSPAMPNVLDNSIVASLVPSQAKPISGDSMSLNSLPEQLSTLGGTPSLPALVTPGQFLQPGLTTSQPSQTAHKDVVVVHASSSISLPQPPVLAAAAPAAKPFSEVQAPLLPLPSSSNPKINGVSSHTRYVNQGSRDRGRGNEINGASSHTRYVNQGSRDRGRGNEINGASSHTRYVNQGSCDRGRGNEFARPVANFTEDFDFEAMNEKFKKEEVWGHLGKSKNNADDDLDSQYVDEVDVPKVDEKSVYQKDDFFDTLSCNALDRDYSRNGRTRFSEQMRLDTETFGDFPRNRGYRGGRGPGRGGQSRGGYYGRNYGYVGRGRGHNIYRAI